jgi:putative ubiquitin-RnfH superfamily antitoxin RatB of RatAB toxin-antitoxin module
MGSLLSYGSPEQPELMEITIKAGAAVQGVIQTLGIPKERVKLILVNHTGVLLDQPLKEGDRVSLFPAEYPVFADWKGSVLSHAEKDVFKED